MGKGSLLSDNNSIYLLCNVSLKANVLILFFYTILVWFMVGRRPLVSFVRYSLCLYHLLILLGSKIIQLTIQQGQCLSIWSKVEFRNFCCLAWKDLEQPLSLNRHVYWSFLLPSLSHCCLYSCLSVFIDFNGAGLRSISLTFLFFLTKGLMKSHSLFACFIEQWMLVDC